MAWPTTRESDGKMQHDTHWKARGLGSCFTIGRGISPPHQMLLTNNRRNPSSIHRHELWDCQWRDMCPHRTGCAVPGAERGECLDVFEFRAPDFRCFGGELERTPVKEIDREFRVHEFFFGISTHIFGLAKDQPCDEGISTGVFGGGSEVSPSWFDVVIEFKSVVWSWTFKRLEELASSVQDSLNRCFLRRL